MTSSDLVRLEVVPVVGEVAVVEGETVAVAVLRENVGVRFGLGSSLHGLYPTSVVGERCPFYFVEPVRIVGGSCTGMFLERQR